MEPLWKVLTGAYQRGEPDWPRRASEFGSRLTYAIRPLEAVGIRVERLDLRPEGLAQEAVVIAWAAEDKGGRAVLEV
jgi:hypothetical protein